MHIKVPDVIIKVLLGQIKIWPKDQQTDWTSLRNINVKYAWEEKNQERQIYLL